MLVNQIREIVEKKLKEKEISILTLCKKIGITQQGYYSIFKNKSLKIKTLQSIAEVLEVPIIIFFDENLISQDNIILNHREYVNRPEINTIGYLRHTGLLDNEKLLNTLPTIISNLEKPILQHERTYLIELLTNFYGLKLISHKTHSKIISKLNLTAEEFETMLVRLERIKIIKK